MPKYFFLPSGKILEYFSLIKFFVLKNLIHSGFFVVDVFVVSLLLSLFFFASFCTDLSKSSFNNI